MIGGEPMVVFFALFIGFMIIFFLFLMEIVDAMNRLNKKLDNIYSGKFKFDFCLREDINIDDLKVKKTKLIDRLKTEVFKTKDTLAKSKTNMERKIIER